MWLTFFNAIWVVILVLVGAFIAADAQAAYDGSEDTPTYSSYIRAWRRRNPVRSVLLGLVFALGLPITAYLELHLVFDLI